MSFIISSVLSLGKKGILLNLHECNSKVSKEGKKGISLIKEHLKSFNSYKFCKYKLN